MTVPRHESDALPGPDEPPWRQVQRWIEDPIGFWEECASRYGETFRVLLGSLGEVVVFSKPDDVREIFQLAPDTYECRHYNDHYAHVMGSRSVLVSDGPEHESRRRLIGRALPRPRATTDVGTIEKATRRVIDVWQAGHLIDVRFDSQAIALGVTLELVFGERYHQVSATISDWFRRELRHDLGTAGPWSRFVQLHPRLRDLLSVAIREGRQRPEPESQLVFDALLTGRDHNGDPLVDEEIHDQVFTLLIAGVDPTALGLAWTLYWLHENDEVLGRLRDELLNHESEDGLSWVLQQPYLEAVVQESLRMYPVVPTPSGRKLTRPVSISGRTYGVGTTLLACTHLVHRREELYPHGARFDPSRFLTRTYTAHEYFPFGGGRRYCVGANLATLELKVSLATILGAWVLEAASEGPVRPVRLGTLLAPSGNLCLRVLRPANSIMG